MLKAKSIDHVNLSVKNLEESVDFYNKLFGFELRKDQPEENSKIIGTDTIKLCLYEDPIIDNGNKAGINHFGFHIENFEEIEINCKKNNVPILYDGAMSWEKSRSIYIQDPNGNEIELSEMHGGGI